jgi:hypothetical protein
MTLDQFIAELEKTPRKWRFSNGMSLRLDVGQGSCCPVTSMLGLHCSRWQSAAHDLGLELEDARAIARAADREPGHDPALRSRLLAACGIKE